MMRHPASITRSVLIVIGLSGGVTGLRSDQPIRAEVARAFVRQLQADDPDVAAFNLELDIRLANRSATGVDIPKPKVGDAETTRIVVLGVDSKQENGPWTSLIQSSWYDVGNSKYDMCTRLPEGEAKEFKNVKSGLLLLRTQLRGLGQEPTIRLDLMVICRKQDGKVISERTTTEAFGLRLPAQ